MKKQLTIGILFISIVNVFAQLQPADVADLTLKVAAQQTEELYYGFAEGDQIVFTFSEVKGKALKEIEIIELPNSSKFMDYKTSSTSKTIKVYKKGVYKFTFKNTALMARICRVNIKRIPKSEELVSFNTDWKWQTLYDTTYVPFTEDSLVGYDTLNYQETIKELVKTEQREEMLMDKNQRVHSKTNENGNKTSLFFTLPQNQVTTYKTNKVVSWAYWVGVDEAGNKAWAQNAKTIKNMATSIGSFTPLTPLGALALGTVTDLMIPTVGEDVSYGIVNAKNKNLFYQDLQYRGFDFGKGVAGYKKFADVKLLQGMYHIVLANDNYMQGINANIKVIAIIETKTYEDKTYDKQKIEARYVQLNKTRMDIASSKVRVNEG